MSKIRLDANMIVEDVGNQPEGAVRLSIEHPEKPQEYCEIWFLMRQPIGIYCNSHFYVVELEKTGDPDEDAFPLAVDHFFKRWDQATRVTPEGLALFLANHLR